MNNAFESEVEEHRPRPITDRRPNDRRESVFGEDRFLDLPGHRGPGTANYIVVIPRHHADVVALEGKDLQPVQRKRSKISG